MRLLGRLMGLTGMIVRYLGMLAGLLDVPFFMRCRGFPMRLSGLVMVFCCFMVIMFRHNAHRICIPGATVLKTASKAPSSPCNHKSRGFTSSSSACSSSSRLNTPEALSRNSHRNS